MNKPMTSLKTTTFLLLLLAASVHGRLHHFQGIRGDVSPAGMDNLRRQSPSAMRLHSPPRLPRFLSEVASEGPCFSSDFNYCHQNADCIPRPTDSTNQRGYECQCKPGYTGDGVRVCEDYNECLEAYPCAPQVEGGYCVDHDPPAKFSCGCRRGFEPVSGFAPLGGSEEANGPGKCRDIDECLLGTHNCDQAHGLCSNTPGSFLCSCEEGYAGDGMTCSEITVGPIVENIPCALCDPIRQVCGPDGYCICKPGFFSTSRFGFCNDIDECVSNTHDCDPNALCTNQEGTYLCICKTGFYGNGKACYVNQCNPDSTSNPCHSNAKCKIIDKGHFCVCNEGYQGDGASCIDIDECVNGHNCSDHSTCQNTDGGFLCPCDQGYESDGTSCIDINECENATAVCEEGLLCKNLDGRYECVQPPPPPSPEPGIQFAPQDLQFFLVGINTSSFNPVIGPLVIGSNMALSTRRTLIVVSVRVVLNGNLVGEDLITITGSMITADVSFIDGLNTLFLAVTQEGGAETIFNAEFWAGSIPLSVALLYNEALYTSRAQITVHAADDPSVKATAETSSGTAVFNNLPYRTIIVQALGGDNLIGQAGTAGEASISVNLIGFNTPSDIDNNDFSRGLEGWNFDPLVQSAGGVVVTNHVELAGPCQVSCERRLAESIEDFDLAVTTYGLGANTVSRTFVANTGKMVQVRYRFVTSEVPGGWYGTEYNDFYAVSIRSLQGGLHNFETNSMNGLGLEAFDFESGSTNWRLLMLPVDTGDTVQVDVTVANVQDGLFDSSVYVDFIDVGGSKWDAVEAGQIKVCVKSFGLPIRGATVTCWDDDNNNDDFMARGTTLVNGCVIMSYPTNCCGLEKPDIHCEISAQCIEPKWTNTKENHDVNKLADFGTQYVSYNENYCGDGSWNGCGAASFSDWLSDIADSVSGFQNQCNLHDVCYGDCSKSRSFCDNNFLSDLYSECSGDFFCEVLAYIFYTAVDVGGESACRAGRDGCTLSQQNLCDL